MGGIVPYSLVWSNHTNCKLVNRPISLGTVPDNTVSDNCNHSIVVTDPISVGIVPDIFVPTIWNNVIFDKWPIIDDMVPPTFVLLATNICKDVIWYNDSGMLPLIDVDEISNDAVGERENETCRFERENDYTNHQSKQMYIYIYTYIHIYTYFAPLIKHALHILIYSSFFIGTHLRGPTMQDAQSGASHPSSILTTTTWPSPKNLSRSVCTHTSSGVAVYTRLRLLPNIGLRCTMILSLRRMQISSSS